jgi:hypothetical protein
LLLNGGRYREMVRLQLLGTEELVEVGSGVSGER